jgi:hypothetical protein
MDSIEKTGFDKPDFLLRPFEANQEPCQRKECALDVRLVYIAPLPIAGLEGLHHRVGRGFQVFVGVLTGGRIATADVSTGETFAKLHPTQSFIDAGLANLAAGRHICIRFFHMLTLCHRFSSY